MREPRPESRSTLLLVVLVGLLMALWVMLAAQSSVTTPLPNISTSDAPTHDLVKTFSPDVTLEARSTPIPDVTLTALRTPPTLIITSTLASTLIVATITATPEPTPDNEIDVLVLPFFNCHQISAGVYEWYDVRVIHMEPGQPITVIDGPFTGPRPAECQ